MDITCDDAPWEDESDGATIVPESIEEQTKVGLERASPKYPAQIRRRLWGVVQLALSGAVSMETLFGLSGKGQAFTLRPIPRSLVPLQWVHVGTGTIPDRLGDTPCIDMSVSTLLSVLNSVLGTEHTLHTPGVQDLLEHVRSIARDFGEVYGILCPWWSRDPSTALQRMEQRRREIFELRIGAIRESWIESSRIPPRRVWDLYSNRVLSFDILPGPPSAQIFEEDVDHLPGYLWTVSHSWVADEDRVKIWTNINGRQWPVPIPRRTTLDHVRIELLNMDAEYVWLDVLCLRQSGLNTDEDIRKEEWRLDVPTIGHIYQGKPQSRPCVTYFNGLGLPLDTSPELLESDRHWFNRVWTLEQTLEGWLPGGLTGEPLTNGRIFFSRLHNLVQSTRSEKKLGELIQDLARRHCTKESDRISALAYLLRCETLPLYDESLSTESAWALLVEHVPTEEFIRSFLQCAVSSPFGLWISWESFLSSIGSPPYFSTAHRTSPLELLSYQTQLQVTDEGRLAHHGRIIGPCRILRELYNGAVDDNDNPLDVTVRLHVGRDSISFTPSGIHGVFLRDMSYFLIGVGSSRRKYWAVIEVVAERGGLRPEVEAIKWGVIGVRRDDEQKIQRLSGGREGARVMFLDGEEALGRSAYTERYMEAFREMRMGGEIVAFDE